MAEESTLSLILKIKKAGSAKEAESELSQLEKTIRRASLGLASYKGVNEDAAGALQTFGINLAQLNNPLTLIATGLKSSIDFTTQWSGEIDKLSRNTGMTAQEASRLATVFGDVGISTQTLETAIKSMTKQGLVPNMDTFKKLAGEYQAIEDPVKRNEWAFKNFGKSALDLTEVLSRTPAQLDELAAAANRSGKVIGQDMVDNAEKLETQLKQLQDQADGLKLKIGGPLVNGISTAVTAWQQWQAVIEINNIRQQEQLGTISHATSVMRQAEVAGLDLTKVAETLGGEYGALDESTRAAVRAQDALNASQITAKTTAVDPLISSTDALSLSTQKLSNTLIWQQASKALDPAAALELGRSLGVVDDKTVIATTKINQLAADLATGKISVTEYQNAVHELAGALGALPDSKTIHVNVITQGDIGQVVHSGNSGPSVRRAAGGPVWAGQSALAGESVFSRPEVFVPAQNGYVLTRQDAMAALSGPVGGNVIVQLNYQSMFGMADRVTLETQVVPLLRQALRL